jgi:membrane-bound lytic murein transglycosylase D
MFIAPTARRFGLTVESGHDDRLDERVETGAALRMFAQLHRRFDDWLLALLSYNSGSPSIDAAIRKTGSRDAWQLAQEGYENDPDYLARVMAAVLIIKNPRVSD